MPQDGLVVIAASPMLLSNVPATVQGTVFVQLPPEHATVKPASWGKHVILPIEIWFVP